MYPCLCLASDEEHPDSVRQAEAWTNLPIEIIPNQLYLVWKKQSQQIFPIQSLPHELTSNTDSVILFHRFMITHD